MPYLLCSVNETELFKKYPQFVAIFESSDAARNYVLEIIEQKMQNPEKWETPQYIIEHNKIIYQGKQLIGPDFQPYEPDKWGFIIFEIPQHI